MSISPARRISTLFPFPISLIVWAYLSLIDFAVTVSFLPKWVWIALLAVLCVAGVFYGGWYIGSNRPVDEAPPASPAWESISWPADG